MSKTLLIHVATTDQGKLTFLISPEEASKLVAELTANLQAKESVVRYDDAVKLLAANSIAPTQVANMWSGMVRSGMFGSGCATCKPGGYCPHYKSVSFTATAVVVNAEGFRSAASTVRNVGPRCIELVQLLAAQLKET